MYTTLYGITKRTYRHTCSCYSFRCTPGIQINQARTTDGVTPLYIASQNGHTDIVANHNDARCNFNNMSKRKYFINGGGGVRILTPGEWTVNNKDF